MIENSDYRPNQPLKKGWSTGACATAGAGLALSSILTQKLCNSIKINLPNNNIATFIAHNVAFVGNGAMATIQKDAGDDPDITHGALITAKITPNMAGAGITLSGGVGVGVVTRPGLPIAVGQPAITPKPRQYITENLHQICDMHGVKPDWNVEISVENGEALAQKTWNPRLGIIGGLSILGTTGVVIPYSCSAWIHSIHRGVDIARANNFALVGAATGKTSDEFLQKQYSLPAHAILDMGDFAGGMLKYIAKNPIPQLIIAGGWGKLAKLAQGHGDLHSARSQINFAIIADWLGIAEISTAQTIGELMDKPYIAELGAIIKDKARQHALELCNHKTHIIIELVKR